MTRPSIFKLDLNRDSGFAHSCRRVPVYMAMYDILLTYSMSISEYIGENLALGDDRDGAIIRPLCKLYATEGSET